jgi:hypothetical protein
MGMTEILYFSSVDCNTYAACAKHIDVSFLFFRISIMIVF